MRERQVPCGFTHVWNLKNKQPPSKTETDSQRAAESSISRGVGGGGGIEQNNNNKKKLMDNSQV